MKTRSFLTTAEMPGLHTHDCMLRLKKRIGRADGYSLALTYELISQFKQTSSNAGAVHCMFFPPVAQSCCLERFVILTQHLTQINRTQEKID